MSWYAFYQQGGDPEHNAASDGKLMQITKEIDGVLLTCGYIADDSNKLVLDFLQLTDFSVTPCNRALQ